MDDSTLINAAQRGDRQALDQLLRKHQSRIYAVCRRIAGNDADALDATQEAHHSRRQRTSPFRRAVQVLNLDLPNRHLRLHRRTTPSTTTAHTRLARIRTSQPHPHGCQCSPRPRRNSHRSHRHRQRTQTTIPRIPHRGGTARRGRSQLQRNLRSAQYRARHSPLPDRPRPTPTSRRHEPRQFKEPTHTRESSQQTSQ